MEVRGDDLPLALPAAPGAVGGGQGGAALLAVPGNVPVLAGAAHTEIFSSVYFFRARKYFYLTVKMLVAYPSQLQLSWNLPPLPLAHT